MLVIGTTGLVGKTLINILNKNHYELIIHLYSDLIQMHI